jgi:arginase family enzyme
MKDLSHFDPNAAGNPKNNIFGLPFSEEEARLIILPVPWEVTVSSGSGTSRAAEHIFNASMQVDIFDAEMNEAWKQIANEIADHLSEKLYISFDIDGLDPKLCKNSGMPVPGGFETDQVFYLVKKIIQSRRKFIGFDLDKIGIGQTNSDANAGARILWKFCNFLVTSNN